MKKNSKTIDFLGLNKGEHDGSVCWIHEINGKSQVQVFLKERITRKKRDGGSLLPVINQFQGQIDFSQCPTEIAEGSLGPRPAEGFESHVNAQFPYFEILEKSGLARFSSKTSPNLQFLTHHFAHALGSAAISPFEKSLILVSDGMGSYENAFEPTSPELLNCPPPKAKLKNHQAGETLSVYLQNGLSLKCVAKTWVITPSDNRYGPVSREGLGLFYGACAQYVFGDALDAGKLMGLAPFGKPQSISSRQQFLASLPSAKAFKPESGKRWKPNKSSRLYENVAATAQQYFEESVLKVVRDLSKKYPGYKKLILTGGTALNCVANTKIAQLGLFEKIYVPPFPSDEGISFGLATWMQYGLRLDEWQPKPVESPLEYWGPISSVPTEKEIEKLFSAYQIECPKDLTESVAGILKTGEIVAWFQGRSECGPRALGHRSILADPGIPGLQKYLNQKIKFREGFRPYGASCPQDEVKRYFDLPDGIESPSMSFTANIRSQWRDSLAAVSHIDHSSRIQTLRRSQEPLFYDLLKSFGRLSGYSVLLNTSFNGPGEPIVETIADAFQFFKNSRIRYLVIGSHVIHK